MLKASSKASLPWRRVVLLVVLTAALVAVGCEDEVAEAPPAEAPPAEAPPAEAAGAPKAAGEGKPGEEYKRPDFPGLARRDPFIFEPPQVKVGEDDEGEERVKEPLENFDIQTLKLVAIITGTAVPKVMFNDSSGFGHIAKEGDRIGRDGGRISDIRANEVEITINPQRTINSDDELDKEEDKEEEVSEPVTIVVLLSDTEIDLPKPPGEDEEGEDILDVIDQGGQKEGEGASEPPAP